MGSVIVTKLDGNAKGGGALSAVAATGSPITFIGLGEHFNDFEQFNPSSFVKRMLGMGDVEGIVNIMRKVIQDEDQQSLLKKMEKGIFEYRELRSQYQNILKQGNVNNIVDMIPGMNNIMQGQTSESQTEHTKRFIYIIDSMTEGELDGKNKLDASRKKRLAIGSGTSLQDVELLVIQYK